MTSIFAPRFCFPNFNGGFVLHSVIFITQFRCCHLRSVLRNFPFLTQFCSFDFLFGIFNLVLSLRYDPSTFRFRIKNATFSFCRFDAGGQTQLLICWWSRCYVCITRCDRFIRIRQCPEMLQGDRTKTKWDNTSLCAECIYLHCGAVPK